jgi:hypothetical protein
MKKILGILFLLAVSLPALAQPGLSQRDQQRFDSYYTRWQQYKAANDRGETISMEKRMLDVYAHYGIPAGTPFWKVATNGHDEARREERREERGEARREERREEHPRWRERLSEQERGRFDSLYSRWMDARNRGDRDDAERLAHHMREIMERSQIPHEVRFEEVASRRDR